MYSKNRKMTTGIQKTLPAPFQCDRDTMHVILYGHDKRMFKNVCKENNK